MDAPHFAWSSARCSSGTARRSCSAGSAATASTGTAGFFEGKLGLKPGKRHATAAGASEAIGGALLTLGALTPVAAGLITGTMITAIRKVHAPKGPWVTEGGYEYNADADRRRRSR